MYPNIYPDGFKFLKYWNITYAIIITNMADERSGSGKSRRNGSAKSKGSNITDTVSKLTVRALQSLNLSEVEDANLPNENPVYTQENELGKK